MKIRDSRSLPFDTGPHSLPFDPWILEFLRKNRMAYVNLNPPEVGRKAIPFGLDPGGSSHLLAVVNLT